MDELQDGGPDRSKTRLAAMLVVAALLLAGGIFGGRALREWLRPPPPPTTSAAAPAERPAPPPAATEAKAVEPTPAPPTPARRPKPVRDARPPAAKPAAPTAGTIRIEADVEGAAAFIDRKFVGTTPVTVENVAPGPHQINVSATGYESYAEAIDVVPGPRDLVIRFRDVRLNETVQVVHKHGIGSCEGRLVADLDGIHYLTANKDHAVTVKLADVESLEVNYLDKNLRLKVSGGKTLNFTDKTANADKLFVFQTNVRKARERLAKGDPPAKK